MNANKKRIMILGAIFLVALAVAGGYFLLAKPEKGEVSQSSYSELAWESCTRQGTFYYDDGYLSFADPKTGKRILVCNTAGCTHKKGECGASFYDAVVNGVNIMGNQLVYVSNEGVKDMNGYYIYTSDLNGMNRKKLATISGIGVINGSMIDNERVILWYQNAWDGDNRELETPQAGIYSYDLKSGKGQVVYQRENQNALVSHLGQMKDGIVFSEYYNDLSKKEITEHSTNEKYVEEHVHTDLIYVSWSGKKKKVLAEDVEMGSYLKTVNDMVYFIKDNEIYQSDIKGIVKKLPYSVGEAEHISIKPNIGEDGLLIQKNLDGTKNCKFEWYHPEDGKRVDYGESNVLLTAQYDTYTYISIRNENSDLQTGYIKTEDMKKKRWDRARPFGTEYLKQLEG